MSFIVIQKQSSRPKEILLPIIGSKLSNSKTAIFRSLIDLIRKVQSIRLKTLQKFRHSKCRDIFIRNSKDHLRRVALFVTTFPISNFFLELIGQHSYPLFRPNLRKIWTDFGLFCDPDEHSDKGRFR